MYFLCVCICVDKGMPQCACQGLRTSMGSWFTPFTMWELEIKNRSLARQWAPIFTVPSHLPKGVAYTFKILTIFLVNNYRFKN